MTAVTDEIMQRLYETHDHLPRSGSRARIAVIDLVLEARRADRKGEVAAAERRYAQAARALRSWSNDRAAAAAGLMERRAWELRNG